MELVGKWSVVEKDKLETCMKSLGLSEAFFRLAPDLGLQMEIAKEGDTYTYTQSVMLPLHVIKFKSGQPFETKNWQGLPIKGSINIGGNMMEENFEEGGVSSKSTTQYKDGKLTRTREFKNNSKCTLTYTKL